MGEIHIRKNQVGIRGIDEKVCTVEKPLIAKGWSAIGYDVKYSRKTGINRQVTRLGYNIWQRVSFHDPVDRELSAATAADPGIRHVIPIARQRIVGGKDHAAIFNAVAIVGLALRPVDEIHGLAIDPCKSRGVRRAISTVKADPERAIDPIVRPESAVNPIVLG